MTINVYIFIVLPVPAFVVDVQQILSIICFDDHFYSCFTPYVLCITCINLFTWLNRFDNMTFYPFGIRLHSLIPSVVIRVVTFLFFTICNHFDRVVDQQRWLKDLTSNVLSALWALLFSYHAFSYAMMAK